MVVTDFSRWALLPLVFSGLSLGTPLTKRGPDDELAKTALDNVYKILDGTLSDGSKRTGCTRENVAVRKE